MFAVGVFVGGGTVVVAVIVVASAHVRDEFDVLMLLRLLLKIICVGNIVDVVIAVADIVRV